jgi:hypothetical protein
MLENYYFEIQSKTQEEILALEKTIVSISEKIDRLSMGEKVVYTMKEYDIFWDIKHQLQKMRDRDILCN